MSRFRRGIAAGACIAGITTIAVGMSIPAGAAVTGPANNLIVGSGSSTTYLMMQSMDLLFNNAVHCGLYVATGTQPLDFTCPPSTGDPLSAQSSPTNTPENPYADLVAEEPALGSSSGIKQLEFGNASGHTTSVDVANNVNFPRSSRGINTGSSGDYTGLNFVAYASDGMSWFHFTKAVSGTTPETTPSALIPSLSQTQLQDIWNGSINNWDQVGGTNAPITVFSAQAGSGTQATWKTYMGFDPTIGGKPVNCSNPGTVDPSTGLVTGESGCVGPAVVLENEDGSLNINAFLNSQSSYLAANATLWGKTTGAAYHSTAALAVGATTIPLTSTAHITNGTTLTVAKLGTGSTAETATVQSVSGLTVTLTHPLAFPHATNDAIGWSTPNPASNYDIQRSIAFFYSYGDYQAQCAKSHGRVNECGGSAQNGNVPALGAITGAPTLNQTSILEGTWPVDRDLYNVYSNGSNSNINPVATTATLNYMSEVGFMCKPQSTTIINPATGNTYVTDIQAVIRAGGFYPLSSGMTTGTINQTPITDEGSVSHPATSLLGARYAPYDNTPTTGLAGGYETASNGDPTGFCLVSSTEDDGSGNPS